MEQVEGLAPAEVGIHVEEIELADNPAAQQRERRARADQAAAADDADFHWSVTLSLKAGRLDQLRFVGLAFDRYTPPEIPEAYGPLFTTDVLCPFIDCITWSVISLTSDSMSSPFGAEPF